MNGGHLSRSICGSNFIPFRLAVSELEGGFDAFGPYYKIVGLFDLWNATPPRPMALEDWPLDMLTYVV